MNLVPAISKEEEASLLRLRINTQLSYVKMLMTAIEPKLEFKSDNDCAIENLSKSVSHFTNMVNQNGNHKFIRHIPSFPIFFYLDKLISHSSSSVCCSIDSNEFHAINPSGTSSGVYYFASNDCMDKLKRQHSIVSPDRFVIVDLLEQVHLIFLHQVKLFLSRIIKESLLDEYRKLLHEVDIDTKFNYGFFNLNICLLNAPIRLRILFSALKESVKYERKRQKDTFTSLSNNTKYKSHLIFLHQKELVKELCKFLPQAPEVLQQYDSLPDSSKLKQDINDKLFTMQLI